MRVDEVANYFKSLLPKASNVFDQKYSKVWRPEDYPVEDNKVEQKTEEAKE